MKKVIWYFIAAICLLFIILIYASQFRKKPNIETSDSEMSRIIEYSFQLNDLVIKNSLVLYDNSLPYHFLDSLKSNVLVFRFSGKSCNYCINGLISEMQSIFPDFETNSKIILVGSDINPRLEDQYGNKRILNFTNENFLIPFEKYNTPFFFVVDSTGILKHFYCPPQLPDHSLTCSYLSIIKKRYIKQYINK